MQDPGTLFIVATPIGNLADISRRAEEHLRRASLIACEDTRRTGNLLSLLGLDACEQGAGKRRLLACHEHNEAQVLASVLEVLGQGEDVVLVSDAGTPLLSDPGYLLVRAARDAGFAVRPVPGASAVQALLSVCPLPTERYRFDGFLPAKAGKRRARLTELLASSAASVVFEAPHRMRDTLLELAELDATRELFVGREMTKKHEAFYCGTAAEVLAALETADALRGEFAFCIAGSEGTVTTGLAEDRLRRALTTLAAELGPSRAAKVLGQLTGRPRSALYDLALQAGEGGRRTRRSG